MPPHAVASTSGSERSIEIYSAKTSTEYLLAFSLSSQLREAIGADKYFDGCQPRSTQIFTQRPLAADRLCSVRIYLPPEAAMSQVPRILAISLFGQLFRPSTLRLVDVGSCSGELLFYCDSSSSSKNATNGKERRAWPSIRRAKQGLKELLR